MAPRQLANRDIDPALPINWDSRSSLGSYYPHRSLGMPEQQRLVDPKQPSKVCSIGPDLNLRVGDDTSP
jgi:hypothetical protein